MYLYYSGYDGISCGVKRIRYSTLLYSSPLRSYRTNRLIAIRLGRADSEDVDINTQLTFVKYLRLWGVGGNKHRDTNNISVVQKMSDIAIYKTELTLNRS